MSSLFRHCQPYPKYNTQIILYADLKTQASFVFFFRKSFAGIPRNFNGRVFLILMALLTVFERVVII